MVFFLCACYGEEVLVLGSFVAAGKLKCHDLLPVAHGLLAPDLSWLVWEEHIMHMLPR